MVSYGFPCFETNLGAVHVKYMAALVILDATFASEEKVLRCRRA
jgi:hypothetical protein